MCEQGALIGELEIAEWSERISPGVMFKRNTVGIKPCYTLHWPTLMDDHKTGY